MTVPVIQPRQNQARFRGVYGEVPVVNAMHASPAAESIKALQIFNREFSVPRKIDHFES